jgi:anti-sigma regulatory factor (Ser/Thr protein kinase)
MEMTALPSLSIPVHEPSQVGEARREAAVFGRRLGLDEETLGRVSIVATEAGRNMSLHSGGGEMLLNGLLCGKQPCLELLAIDRGRGMENVDKCLRDGYSTAGTPGTGLGAIARLADEFDIFSAPGSGTVLMARLCSRHGARQPPDKTDYSAVSVAVRGEVLCGDAWAVQSSHSGETFLVADGLGHGQYAEEAAREAVRIFHQSNGAKLADVIERAHGALRATRGAALAIARIDLQQHRLTFAGVGNISAAITAEGGSRSMVSMNGIVGHQMHRVQEFVYPWNSGALLIMHSDGVSAKWDLTSYMGLSQRAPGVIAGVLYRDFSRQRDDVTVLVARGAGAKEL